MKSYNDKINVILLTIDCLRADHLGCLGYHKDITPNMDNLAKEGALFCEAISNGPVTPYSFPSILTSSYPLVYPLKYLGGLWPAPVLVGRTTLAEMLERQGYSTAAVHTNPYLSSYFRYNRGFDFFKEPENIASGHWVRFLRQRSRASLLRSRIYKRFLPTACDNPSAFIQLLCGNPPYARAEIINQIAISWLESTDSENFFLWLHYLDPHNPLGTPKLAKNLVKHAAFFLSRLLHKSKRARSISQNDLYEEEIKYVDHKIGLLFEKLKDAGIWLDNSLIIVTADHGGPGHGPYLHDRLLRVPLIICGPEVERNLRIEEQVSLLDLPPTITDMLGLKEVKSFQGESLLPSLQRKERQNKAAISEYQFRDRKGYSYRTKDWKYIFTLDERGKQVNELYDLQNDPEEKENLAKKEKWKMLDLRKRIKEHMAMEEVEKAGNIEKLKIRQKINALKRRGRI